MFIYKGIGVINFALVMPVQLPWIQHQYFTYEALDLLSRYKREGLKPRIINSIMPEGITIGKGALLINCNLEVHVAH